MTETAATNSEPAATSAAAATESTPATTNTETKPASILTSGKAPEAAKPEATKEPAAPAEAKYEFKDVPADYDVKALEAFAKENKISPEAAQKLVARDLANTKAFQDRISAQMKDLMENKWVEELKSDKALGGANFDKSVETARRAIDALSPELREGIDKAQLGNHPVLFKIMHHFGSKMREDTFVRGNSSSGQSRTWESAMYDKK